MKLSLNETWKRCKKMWKGVIAILDLVSIEGEEINVGLAKKIWLQQNGYKQDIWNDCFFCNYIEESLGGEIGNPETPGDCPTCPGTTVDPDFACETSEYHWLNEPHEFYKKLLQLDRKRRRK